MSDYHHGVRVVELNEGSRSIRVMGTAVIGMVCTAADADPDAFPLNQPVLVTRPQQAIANAGSQGTLKKSLAAIAAIVNTPTIIVRVDEGNDATETTSNVIGGVSTEGQYTGLQALLIAQSTLGVKPRILGVPGLDSAAVASELATICKKLRAFAYVSDDNADSIEASIDYRANFAARELMVVRGNFTAWDTDSNSSQMSYAVARAMALRAYIDQNAGWHKTLSNVEVSGVDGLTQPIFWDLQDPSTDANRLNENDITVLIREQGFRFWGSRTCSDDPLFQFENYTRTAQILADTIAEAHMWAVDKPITPVLVKNIVEGINAKFRELRTLGYIVDAQAWYNEELNDQTTLKSGKLYIDYDYTPVPPLENLQFQQRITDRYLIDFASSVSAA